MTVTTRMLINASHDEERRVAIIHNDYLQELDIESAHKVITKSNIYRGTITKVEASLQACFVEYGSGRQGFLPINEIHPDYWKEGVDKSQNPRRVNIQDVLEGKQQILVQVVKEERGNKGAALTTFISLAGRYLVLSPNTMRGGISRKLSDEERRALKAIIKQLDVPDDVGLIVRTAGRDQNLEALQRDFSYLTRLWDEIRIKGNSAPAPSLIYMEGDLATRAIRDHFSDEISEIWVDNHEIYTRTKQFVHAVIPGKEKLVKLYRGKKPLFRHYGIESQCEEIHQREIRLRSGGSLVFDPTEALTSIDINSSRSTKSKHIDETALATNLEAAEEIARQLRIRDIGGLVVIDFIDMASRKHGQQIEEALRDACQPDKARIQITRISRFGLMEMSRQRLHPSVREVTSEVCPRCQGRGSVLTTESMALHILTRIEDWAESGKGPEILVQVPSEASEYLMNNKRDYIARIEASYELKITLQIRQELMIPHYKIERLWNESNQKRTEVLEDTSKVAKPRPSKKLRPLKPVVGIPTPPEDEPVKKQQQPTKKKREAEKPSLIKRLVSALFGGENEDEKKEEPTDSGEDSGAKKSVNNDNGRNRGRRGGRNRRPARTQGQGEQQDKLSQNSSKNEQKRPEKEKAAEGEEEVKPKRRRRRRKPANRANSNSDNANQESVNSDATHSDGAKSEGSNTEGGNAEKAPSEKSSQKKGRTEQSSAAADKPTATEKTPIASDENASNDAAVAEGSEKKPRRRRRRRKPSAEQANNEGEGNSDKSTVADAPSASPATPTPTPTRSAFAPAATSASTPAPVSAKSEGGSSE